MRAELGLVTAALLAALVSVSASTPDLSEFLAAQQELLRVAGPQPNRLCSPVSPDRQQQLNLTAKEQAVLPSICWQEPEVSTAAPVIPSSGDRAVPEDVTCKVTTWCAPEKPVLASICIDSTS